MEKDNKTMNDTNTGHSSMADDINRLRQEGVSDDDILSGYRTYAPHNSGDVDRLLSEGVSVKRLVDGISTAPHELHSPPTASPQDSEGALEKSRKALQYGAANAAVGVGRTAHWLGEASGLDTAKTAGEAIADFGKSIVPENYKPASQGFYYPQGKDAGAGGFGWGYLPRTILEGAPGLAIDLGAGALAGPAGFMASSASRSFGPSMDVRVENNGGKPASVTDYVAAGGSAALQAYMNKVGINPAISGVTKGAGLAAISQIPGQVAKAGAVDALAGAVGNLVDQVGVTAGTDKGLTIDPHEMLGAAASSGAMGASVRGVRGAGDITNAVRYSDMDPVVAGRLADRFNRLGIEPRDPEGAFKAVTVAEEALSGETGRARKDLRTMLGREESSRHREAMDTAEVLLSNGETISMDRLGQLRDALGSSALGKRYIEKLEERSALNSLKAKGRFEDGYFAGGVSSSPLMEDTINPASWARNPTKRAIGGAAAIIGLGSELEMARALVAPAALAKAMALQGGIYGAARTVDAITGSRNPVHEFTSRFGADGSGGVPLRPVGSPMLDEAALPIPARLPPESALAAHEGATGLEAVQRVAQEAVQAQRARQAGKGSSEASEAASEAIKDSGERIDPRTIRIDHRGYSVERPRETIVSVDRYTAKTRAHMNTRANFGDGLESIAGDHAGVARSLVNKLNLQARSWEEAKSYVEDAINELPWGQRSQAWDVYLKHEAGLRATYRD